ncbi:MAG: DUF1735 and LamG domain-containing protein [Prevotella sp.]|nr:DUF1735 and LamG domain-containing protein [Prevotella sp.]MCI1281841.1 DUF1735 and LamG domain-containing protein [Prevotella sp.]
MKIKNTFLSAAVALCLGMTLAACTDGDDQNYSKEGLLITGTEATPVQKFVLEDTPSSYAITVKATQKVNSDVKVKLAIDTSLVAEYNAKNSALFYPIPLSSVELENSEVTIAEGTAVSTAANVKIMSTEDFVDGRTYMIPVTIQSVSTSGDEQVIDKSKTLFLKVSRVINFYSLTYDWQGSSNYNFTEAQTKTLTAYTIQFKFYSYGFGRVGDIKTFLNVGGAVNGDNGSNAWRFGENGSAGGDILQWIRPGGFVFSSTHFKANRWYMVTCTYDGAKFCMYVDDNPTPDGSASGPGKKTYTQHFAIGMSWGNYNRSQYYSGRLAEIRLWDRALTPSEIAVGLCGVDAKSSGLVAYWKMDQPSGTIIKDFTGNGYDADWNDTYRSDDEVHNFHHTDYGKYLHWRTDDKNKCAQ